MINNKEIVKESLKEESGKRAVSISRIISAITTVLIIVVVLSGGSLFNLGLDQENLKDPTTWFIIIVSVPLSSMSFKAAVDFMIATMLPNRKIVVETMKEYEERVDKIEDDSELFLKDYNRKNKINKYEEIVNKQKNKFSKRYASQKRWKFWRSKLTEEQYDEEICRFQEKLTRTYIDANIDKLSVNYKMVYASHFSKIIKDTKYNQDIDSTLSATMKKQLSKKMLSKLVFGIMAASIVVTVGEPQYRAFVGMIAISCIMQFVTGLVDSVSIYDSSILAPMEIKINIMKEYEAWVKKNPNALKKIQDEAEARAKAQQDEYDRKLNEIEAAIKEKNKKHNTPEDTLQGGQS